MGRYFDPNPEPPHQCALPMVFHREFDGWLCDCGKAYVIEMLPARDILPGESTWQWRRAPEHDEPIQGY